MSGQTESYIVLKPIAERFSRIASEITDDEIRDLIKGEMREQLRKLDFLDALQVAIDEWFEDEENCLYVTKMLEQYIKEKFSR